MQGGIQEICPGKRELEKAGPAAEKAAQDTSLRGAFGGAKEGK